MRDLLTSNCSIILSNATSQTIKLLPVSSVGSEKRERVIKEERKREEWRGEGEKGRNCCPNNF